MEPPKTICLLNDSFPPLIDGVANTVVNYARVLQANRYDPVVVTPFYPDTDDSEFPYPVIRYPSIDFRKLTGYRAGVPFSPELARDLQGRQVALLHSHCPVASTFLARGLRQIVDAPLVLTYHTKFDIDIANILKTKPMRQGSIHALVENISACDEIWTVSQGASDNLHSLGYEGECVIMPNGVDLPRGRAAETLISEATKGCDLPRGVPVFLFVGRMMWYKGLRITLDALSMLKHAGKDFRMVFVGSGSDAEEVTDYAAEIDVSDKCIFTGSIHDREMLRAWYTRADLFLFPSTFDTNGLVVREAAACGLGSVLIRGSCASEGVADGRNGLLIAENPASMAQCLLSVMEHPEAMSDIGKHASEELYLSWEDSVKNAIARYEIVIDRYRCGQYPPHRHPMDGIMKANGNLMEDLAHLQMLREDLHQNIRKHIRDRF